MKKLLCSLLGHKHMFSHLAPMGRATKKNIQVHTCKRCPDLVLVWAK